MSRCTFAVPQVIRGGGAVGTVEVMWIINSTGVSFPGSHEFVSANGSIVFSESQTSMNLTVSIVNDLRPSLDAIYQLTITGVSQVTHSYLVCCLPIRIYR